MLESRIIHCYSTIAMDQKRGYMSNHFATFLSNKYIVKGFSGLVGGIFIYYMASPGQRSLSLWCFYGIQATLTSLDWDYQNFLKTL